MFLSRLTIDRRNAVAARDLEDVCQMHRTVMSLFPGFQVTRDARASVAALYRVDLHPRAMSVSVIVQSVVRPNFRELPGGYALEVDPAVRSMDSALEGLRDGRILRFRLRANTVKKVDTKSGPDGRRRNGRRMHLRSDAERTEWLKRKAKQSGFRLVTEGGSEGDEMVSFSSGRKHTGRRGRVKVTFESVLIDGLLVITDADRFRSAVRVGIGHEKAYGCGLLSIARAS